ncbi:GDSL-type esterase/lipase family protein [Bacillus sp. SCS-153A]|uniref:GDSL-type esterase/lipase family protein n=1 Tax=Rossellomorea sedimentorum TaxID=3115294 RepID=UPI0039063128
MKLVFIFLSTAMMVTLAVFSLFPTSISSPAPSQKEDVLVDETAVFSEVVERRSVEDDNTYYLEKVAFDYMMPDIEIKPSGISHDSFAIVGIGDSLTLGTGSEEAKGYLDQIKMFYERKNEEVVLVNHGVYGAQARHLIKMLEDPNLQSDIKQADVLFMTLGGNDLVSIFNHNFLDLTIGDFTKGEENFKSDLRKIMSAIRLLNEDVPVYFVGIFNPVFESLSEVKEFDEIISSWNIATKNLLEMYSNTTFISIQHLFEEDTSRYLSEDLFHPNDEGYKRIGEEVISRTEELLMVQRNPL